MQCLAAAGSSRRDQREPQFRAEIAGHVGALGHFKKQDRGNGSDTSLHLRLPCQHIAASTNGLLRLPPRPPLFCLLAHGKQVTAHVGPVWSRPFRAEARPRSSSHRPETESSLPVLGGTMNGFYHQDRLAGLDVPCTACISQSPCFAAAYEVLVGTSESLFDSLVRSPGLPGSALMISPLGLPGVISSPDRFPGLSLIHSSIPTLHPLHRDQWLLNTE